MLAFIDESGDAGLAVDRGASRYFVLALVLFVEDAMAEQADLEISKLRNELRLHPRYEFKFNKMSRGLRLQVIRIVATFDFRYYLVVVDKRRLDARHMLAGESLLQRTSDMLVDMVGAILHEATLIIDGEASKPFRGEIERAVRRRANVDHRAVARVKLQDSRRNNLLQVADMIAGAAARRLSGKSDAENYLSQLQGREGGVLYWPR